MLLKKVKNCFSIHYSFIVLMLFALFCGLIKLLLIYFLFLLLHEKVHAIVAKKLGYKIGKIKLLATGAVLEAESDEFSFSDEIRISVSAPLFNLFIAIVILSLWWIYPETYNYTQDLCVINLAIFAFNMLPIFPLDGGRVLLAFLSCHMERKKAVLLTKITAMILSLLIFALFVASLFIKANFSLGIIAITLFVGTITEDKSAAYKRVFFLERKKKRAKTQGVEVKHVLVCDNLAEEQLVKLINARFFTIFNVVDKNFRIIKQQTEAEILEKLANKNCKN